MDRYGNNEDKIFVSRIIDYINQSSKIHNQRWSNFLDPNRQLMARQVYEGLKPKEISLTFYGGYHSAERKIAIFSPEYYDIEDNSSLLDVLSIVPKGNFRKLSHRDYLGAMLSTGIVRDKIGDIILEENEAKVVLLSDISYFVVQNLSKIGNCSVNIERVDIEALKGVEPKIKEIKTTIPSLRLDCIISEGFGTSRSQIAECIPKALVKVNHKVITKQDYIVKEMDIISVQGKGRILVAGVGGLTKKGRVSVIIHRFI